ncbi:MAG: stage II sporulation protein R [Clostridia bacterium]|nr:stage II sporulation protein R [Clostridia bacterium]
MKRYILIFFLLILFAVCGTLLLTSCAPSAKGTEDYIRIHVRANSDTTEDQTVKLAVRDALVQYLTPLALRVKSRDEMWALMEEKKAEMKKVADDTLYSCGYPYLSAVSLRSERFPTRTYGDLTLEEGVYDAVIVELGSGEGQNWWCVAYPPLCFIAAEETGTEEVIYRSWIAELFKK